ncbi:MAG: helix-turn-helix transcriptional regulator [Cyclobacteriaceae bacterium]|nr:helix-turn-helix transcriptional regulator [Cyclobacteriaceae bacterium]
MLINTTAMNADRESHLNTYYSFKKSDEVAIDVNHINNLQHITPPSQFGYIYDCRNNEMLHSRGLDELLSPKHTIETETGLFNHVHPEDLCDVLMLNSISGKILNKLPAHEVKKNALYMDYRLRKRTGEYIRVLHQWSVLEAHEIYGAVTSITICTDISHIKLGGAVQHRWKGPGKELFDQMVSEKKKKKANGLPVSKREYEIIQLLGKGLRSNEIADELHLSVHTVNTHRRNILRKFDVSSLAEVLMKVFGVLL